MASPGATAKLGALTVPPSLPLSHWIPPAKSSNPWSLAQIPSGWSRGQDSASGRTPPERAGREIMSDGRSCADRPARVIGSMQCNPCIGIVPHYKTRASAPPCWWSSERDYKHRGFGVCSILNASGHDIEPIASRAMHKPDIGFRVTLRSCIPRILALDGSLISMYIGIETFGSFALCTINSSTSAVNLVVTCRSH